MLYQHRLEYQEALQKAVRRLPLNDQEIVDRYNLGVSKSTIQRFRAGDLKKYYEKAGDFKLKPLPAETLWNCLASEIQVVLREDGEFRTQQERIAANAMSAFYSGHESQTKKWIDEGLGERYFCYKPSFLFPGQIVKSRFDIELLHDEYFKVTDHQEHKSEAGTILEDNSEGFGFSKSNRLWIFLRESKYEQPRIICFHRKVISRGPKISRLYGKIIESERASSDEVFSFNIALVSAESEVASWKDQHKGREYNGGEQIGVFQTALSAKLRDVHLDSAIIEYLRADLHRPTHYAEDGMDLRHLGSSVEGLNWFLDEKNRKNLRLVENTVFYRNPQEDRSAKPLTSMFSALLDAIKAVLSDNCRWTDLFTKDELGDEALLYNSLSSEQRVLYDSWVLRPRVVSRKFPLLQVMILTYRDARPPVVLFGWTFQGAKENSVYLSSGRETVAYFKDYFNRLMTDHSVRVHDLPHRQASDPSKGKKITKK